MIEHDIRSKIFTEIQVRDLHFDLVCRVKTTVVEGMQPRKREPSRDESEISLQAKWRTKVVTEA